ncbi:phage tail assembly protein [Methylosinus sp. KRF6]|uniref:phage tail assembly protein n=1 Tax=Methylosinus sp. KRF6 TaxID=2846853 RepID=UPI001C0E708B|nr:phage tail assembly protein [Methylosinus sp. KRF6]MBU3890100.1 phage tail assembly protein [Methylosinus sp. KRF6]
MVDGAQEFQTKLMQAAQGASATAAAAPATVAVDAATAAAAPANAITPIVDFDAGGNWGGETIALAHPFKTAGVTYSTLNMRTATGLDVTRFYSTGRRSSIIDFAIGLLSSDNGPIDARVFGLMHGSDSAAIISKASDFLGGSPQT